MKQYAWAYLWGIGMLTISSIPYLEVPGVEDMFGIDKLAHFTEYLIFAILIFKVKSKYRYAVLLKLVFILTFAGADELHQKLIPGRMVQFPDFMANAIGSISGYFIKGRNK